MPEPIPFPSQPTAPVAQTPPSADTPPPARPRLTGWRKVLVLLGFLAAGLRLLMFLLLHGPAHHATNTLPTFPFHAGDIFTLTPGDANIAKWAQNPLADGFVVQQVETDGHPVPGTKVCALEPDYMADSQQPGGTLTLLSQQLPDTWQVRWSGGNTLPPYMKQKDNFDANCGTIAVVLMTNDQLHALHDILAGISTSAPPAK